MEEVAEVYSSYMSPKYDQRALQKLETDGALERTFWPSVSNEMSAEHVWVIVCLVNEKMREGTNPLLFLTAVDSEGQDASKFEVFFARLVDIAFDEAGVFANPEAAASRHQATAELRLHYASFLVHVYQCLESATVRRCCIGQCLSLSMWRALSDQRLAAEIKATPALQQRWDELPPVTAPTQSSSGATAPSATPPSKQKGGKKRKAAEEATHTSSTATVTAGPMEQFFPTLANYFLSSLARAVGDSSAGDSGDGFTFVLQFLQKFCELVVDLLSQLPTRRFLRTVLDDMHFVTFARLLLTAQKGCGGRAESEFKVLKEMLDRIESLMHFEIDDLTGRALSSLDMVARNNARLTAFQQSLFAAYGAAVRQVYFSSLGQLGRRDVLTKHCNELLSVQQLVHVTGGLALFDAGRDVNTLLRLLESSGSVSADGEEEAGDIEGEAATTLSVSSSQAIKLSAKQATQLKTLLIDVLCDYLVLRESQLDAVNRLPLYPSEELLWDLSQLPVVSKPSKSSTSGGSASEASSSSNQFLTLPKLNLQFLTTYDYLLRNFELFRLESAYEIRADIMDAVRRMLPKRGSRPGQAAVFSGWSRMAMQPISVGIDEVSKPQLGQLVPGRVTASVEVDLSKLSRDIRSEWESLREHDVVFLVCISDPQPLPSTTAKSGSSSSSNVAAYADEEEETRAFRAQYGVRYVRGGQIFEVRDGEDGTILNDPARQMDSEQGTQHKPSSRRKFRLHMDTAQYYNDMKAGVEECYTETNLVVRRHSKENNFKPVLETIRDLMNCPAMGGAAMVPGTAVNQAGGGGKAKESDPECFHDVPAWLHEVFLGYGAPDSAHYRSLAKKKALALAGKAVGSSKAPSSAAAGVVTATAAAPSESLAYADTFLDAAHAVEAFTTGAEVEPTAEVYFAVGDDFPASAAAKKTNLSTLQMASGPNVKALQVDRSVSPAVLSALPPPPYRVTVWHGAATAPATSAGKVPEAAAVATPTSPATPASAGKKGAKATASASKKRGGKAAATAAEPSEAAAAPMATEESASAPATPAAKTATKKRGARRDIVLISAYPDRCPGPYPTEEPPRNAIRFTPAQVEAIRSGMNPGLTMVVGPPGTGKTDTAVQLISNLYHNFPQHRILLITHSNAALNDLFAKIMERNVEARHLLRLGAGEAELRETLQAAAAAATVGGGQGNDEVFSKHGRVQWCLARRLALLEEVQRLGLCFSTTTSSGVSSDVGDVGYTCETAGYFYQYHVRTRIAEFETKLKALEGRIGSKACSETVADIFPFSAFFANAPKQPLFGSSADKQEQFRADREVAVGCIRHIHKVFNELADYRPLELLRSQGHRCDYMLMKQARVVAMTCTHAAMTRRKLMALGFRFDTVVMEESAQILEVETLIPMLLQRYNTSDGDNSGGGRLQRVTLIGDHHQLPPVIKNQAIQSYSHLDQSLFSRFIRLGVPHVLLDQQGRARPEIASLYSWRYTRHSPATGALVQQLSNLSIVQGSDGQSSYARANAGFLHPFQLVDVGDFQGKGETAPTPYFYQNLGEAEYIVAVYQYMRLLGYPASAISVLTTYNGQKSLIRDVMRQRCANNATFGMPAAISTVDQYQGQQNDYVLLSLVRTRHVGHLRDVRRLVVAMSRARLGLYVFCRKALFSKCIELQPVFRQLVSEHADASETGASGRKAGAKKGAKVTAGAAAGVSPGNQLMLVSGEAYPSQRPVHFPASDLSAETLHCVQDATAMGVLVYQMVQLAQHQYNEQQLQKMHAAAAAAPMQTGDGDESDDPEDGFEEASDGEDAEAQ